MKTFKNVLLDYAGEKLSQRTGKQCTTLEQKNEALDRIYEEAMFGSSHKSKTETKLNKNTKLSLYTVILFAIALELKNETLTTFIRSAGHSLSNCYPEDRFIIQLLNNKVLNAYERLIQFKEKEKERKETTKKEKNKENEKRKKEANF